MSEITTKKPFNAIPEIGSTLVIIHSKAIFHECADGCFVNQKEVRNVFILEEIAVGNSRLG